MMRLLRVILVLVVLGLAGLAGYAYLGDMTPERREVRVPVSLGGAVETAGGATPTPAPIVEETAEPLPATTMDAETPEGGENALD